MNKNAFIKALLPIAFAKVDPRTITAKDKIRALELTAKLCGIVQDGKKAEEIAAIEETIRLRSQIMKQVRQVMADE